jgi:hypothetical protein
VSIAVLADGEMGWGEEPLLKIAKIPNPVALILLVDLTLQRSNSFARRQKFLAESQYSGPFRAVKS